MVILWKHLFFAVGIQVSAFMISCSIYILAVNRIALAQNIMNYSCIYRIMTWEEMDTATLVWEITDYNCVL